MRLRILTITVFAMLSLPAFANAHAIPVSMTPESSAVLDTPPASVSIRFSERVDPGASAITITSPSMTMRKPVQADRNDPRTLSVPVMNDGDGTYLVSWSVVSADDGHFTKGGYAFAVGKGTILATTTQASEVITIATAPEALGMTIELMGNGLIWAVLLFFALAVRPLRDKLRDHKDFLRDLCARLMYFAGILVFSGGLMQLFIKSDQLATLQDISFWQGFAMYVGTTAGSATLYRMLAVVAVLVMYIVGKKHIFNSERFTWIEGGLMALMAVFAYFRAIISHATANPFFPPLSIGFNFVHVIEKDLWAGLALILVLLAVQRKARNVLAVVMPRISLMLAVDFGLISVTAVYIVWLHLKDFGNLFTTQWGTVFLQLLIAAVILIGVRGYHVFSRLWKPRLFSGMLPFSLGAEFAIALLVVYYSSVVIITSPPLVQPNTPVLSSHDQGVTITLSRDRYEYGMFLLMASSDQVPTLTLADENGTTGALSIDLSKRFNGGYVFPESVLAGNGPFKAVIAAPQTGGYDAHATFEFAKNAFEAPPDWESKRPLDSFTITMILIALAALVTAVVLYRVSKRETSEEYGRVSDLTGFQVFVGFSTVGVIALIAIGSFGSSSLANQFKATCEADGNMWHLMQPMKAGMPTAEASTEGCMWGMGNSMYMFPDQREYDYYRSFPQADVELQHDGQFVAGRPSTFSVRLKEADGSPATLFVDMTKLIHVVVVSSDQTVFAHIHPDDNHPLSETDIDASTFTLNYTFPKSGAYLISVDYVHGLTLESKQFKITVTGTPQQTDAQKTYPSPGMFDGYYVSLDYFQPIVGEVTTLQYQILKDGKPVTNIVPYLEAAMHISAVKNDLSTFIHTHGEVHPPGMPLPPILVKNGKIVHSMSMMNIPPMFGPTVEAHLIFPSAGLYTIWGEFKVNDRVIPTSFTVRVESGF